MEDVIAIGRTALAVSGALKLRLTPEDCAGYTSTASSIAPTDGYEERGTGGMVVDGMSAISVAGDDHLVTWRTFDSRQASLARARSLVCCELAIWYTHY